ncbi:hypothetical protein K7I13_00765 [Brucepastera parasyntrophica]|uniref:hypothetical protein n=1 Tax=Brucepastera parasyntrophica TaxID=2880008 RepID=UPI002109D3DF|nr:hypothetical protein [Brucepastera parasyntrophica]ULQ59912.1 hypothetical protein K7I13_00765 [Brucepastera parasyntrophica]
MYKLFKRKFKKNGKDVYYWYYWYYDESGNRIPKACKNPDGSGKVTLKRNAQLYIDMLNVTQIPEIKPVQSPVNTPGVDLQPTFAEFTHGMFRPGAEHLDRWSQHGKVLKDSTRRDHRDHLDKFLVPWLGHLTFPDITAELVDDILVSLYKTNKAGEQIGPYSASKKNNILYTLNYVFAEAKRAKLIQYAPDFETFRRPKTGQDILLDSELELLFPEDPEQLEHIWSLTGPSLRDYPGVGLMPGALSWFAVSAGLRSGEARGMHYDQLYPIYTVLLLIRRWMRMKI